MVWSVLATCVSTTLHTELPTRLQSMVRALAVHMCIQCKALTNTCTIVHAAQRQWFRIYTITFRIAGYKLLNSIFFFLHFRRTCNETRGERHTKISAFGRFRSLRLHLLLFYLLHDLVRARLHITPRPQSFSQAAVNTTS